MKKIIISDTTTLIVLEKQQHLFLLCKLFEQVINGSSRWLSFI
jgi:predicted nucleic acid-binding protein